MTTPRPTRRDTITLLATSLALALSLSACDRRAVEDESAATTAEPGATDEAGMPPPVTDVDSPVATNTPEPPDPRDMTTGVAPTGSATAAAASATSQADALALLIVVNEHEIATADQALMKQVTGPVLAFARMMKRDHAANLTDTTRLGGAASTAPAVTRLRNQGDAGLKALAMQDGAAYEKAYIDAMVRGHTETLALIDGTLLPAATADNVRQHFTATRATVAEHLARAREIQVTLE